MSEPLVSVVMTVYNGGSFVKEAVRSIFDQTFTDFEFIVIDNASTDGTRLYLKDLHEPRLRLVLNEKNEGQTKALNRGLKMARGEFIARMDADDVSLPERLAVQVNHLRGHLRQGVVGSWHEEIDEHGKFLKLMRYPSDPLEIRCNLISDGDLTLRCFAHPTALFRAAALRDVGGYDESVLYAQDYELWTRMLAKYDIGNVPCALLRYRVSKKSTSNRHRSEMSAELDRIVRKNLRRLWPDISECDENILSQMLRNKPIREKISPLEVYALFDALFEHQFSNQKLSKRHLRMRDRIKAYYSPRLIRKAPLPAISYLARCALRQPSLCLDHKIQKNFLKAVLR